jgi:hypothetical protein
MGYGKMDLVFAGSFFFILNFILGVVIAATNGQRLSNYLRKYNYKKWKGQRILKTPGTNNPFKTFPYIYNNQDIEDREILRLKKSIRYWILHGVVSFILIIVWGVGGVIIMGGLP